MKIRTISGACFVALITGFFLLREFVHPAVFQILIWFMCACGTYEVVRATKGFSTRFLRILALIVGIGVIPLYVVLEYFFSINATLMALCVILSAFIVGLVYSLAKFKDANYLGIIALVYPSILLLAMASANCLENNSFIALLLVFVISPFTDTMAYLVGMVYNKIRKGQAKKLCPNLSPKKTVAGAIGGLVGGAVGSVLVYFVFNLKTALNIHFLVFACIGIVASVLTQAGDLFESFIKRRVGIKDMGKIMPGHGGVMDRIDGISFASLFIYIVFLVL